MNRYLLDRNLLATIFGYCGLIAPILRWDKKYAGEIYGRYQCLFISRRCFEASYSYQCLISLNGLQIDYLVDQIICFDLGKTFWLKLQAKGDTYAYGKKTKIAYEMICQMTTKEIIENCLKNPRISLIGEHFNRPEYNNNIACWAAENGHLDIIKTLLANPGYDPNLGVHGEYPITKAAEYGHFKIVKLLLDDPRFDFKQPHYLKYVLPAASQAGHKNIVDLLFEHPRIKSDSKIFNIMVDELCECFERLARNDNVMMVKFLLKKTITYKTMMMGNYQFDNKFMRDMLSSAVQNDCQEMAVFLLSPGKKYSQGDYPQKYLVKIIYNALKKDNWEMAKLIMTHPKTNLNPVDSYNTRKFIQIAFKKYQRDLVELLFATPAIFDSLDKRDRMIYQQYLDGVFD